MSISLLFWIVMVIWLIFDLSSSGWPRPRPTWSSLIFWILLALLGWQVFGPGLHK